MLVEAEYKINGTDDQWIKLIDQSGDNEPIDWLDKLNITVESQSQKALKIDLFWSDWKQYNLNVMMWIQKLLRFPVAPSTVELHGMTCILANF